MNRERVSGGGSKVGDLDEIKKKITKANVGERLPRPAVEGAGESEGDPSWGQSPIRGGKKNLSI